MRRTALKHSDYQRVYKASRKHFSTSIDYFYRRRESAGPAGPRVGLTVGRVLGKAVVRNRIKRRMREAVRLNVELLGQRDLDIVLHPRRSVAAAGWNALHSEVAGIFQKIARSEA